MAEPLVVPGSLRTTDINTESTSHTVTLPPASVGDLDVLLVMVPTDSAPSSSGYSLVAKSVRQTNVATVAFLARVVQTARSADSTITVAPGATRRAAHTAFVVSGAAGLPTVFANSNSGTEGSASGVTTTKTDCLLIGSTARQAVCSFTPGSNWTELADHGPSSTTRPISSFVGTRLAPTPGLQGGGSIATSSPTSSARADQIVAIEPASPGATGIYRQRVNGAMEIIPVRQLVNGVWV